MGVESSRVLLLILRNLKTKIGNWYHEGSISSSTSTRVSSFLEMGGMMGSSKVGLVVAGGEASTC